MRKQDYVKTECEAADLLLNSNMVNEDITKVKRTGMPTVRISDESHSHP